MTIGAVLKNVLILISLLGMVYWGYLQSHVHDVKTRAAKPQEYMQQLSVTTYTEEGKEKNILQAAYWEFIPDRAYSYLTQPFLTVYKTNGDIWYLSASKALAWHPTIRDRITKLDLQDGVIIERPEFNHAIPTKIEALAMQYLPDKETISSDEFVSMQQPGLFISGYGMLGHLEQNRIELHDKITTIYTP